MAVTFSELRPGFASAGFSFRWWRHSNSPVIRLDEHVTSTHLVLRIGLAGTSWPPARRVRTEAPYRAEEAMTLQSRNLDSPDEMRKFDNGEFAVVNLPGTNVGRAVFQPGWRWSNDVKPLAGTESCQAAHTGYIISGHMHEDGRWRRGRCRSW